MGSLPESAERVWNTGSLPVNSEQSPSQNKTCLKYAIADNKVIKGLI